VTVSSQIVLFAEDPGAANYVLEVPAMLRQKGFSVELLSDGPATRFFEERGETATSVGNTSADEVLDSLQPAVVAVGTAQNPRSLSNALVESARVRGIPTVAFVDMAVDAELRFSGGTLIPLKYAPEWLAVADTPTRDAFVALGFPQERIVVCGHPGFDRLAERCASLVTADRRQLRMKFLPGITDARPAVMFVAEHADPVNPQRTRRSPSYTLQGRGSSSERLHIVLEEVLDTLRARIPSPYLVVRLHPKNSLTEFEAYASEIDYFSVGGDPFPLLFAVDVVIGLASMLLLEAYLAGRQVVTVVPDPAEAAWVPEVVRQAVPPVHTRAGLRDAVETALCSPNNVRSSSLAHLIGGRERFASFLATIAPGRMALPQEQ
jgi:hypothetical protein